MSAPAHVAVAGGGIAGLAAATVLAERGVRVTLCEAESFLGGRAASWPDRLATGEGFEMERGFHAFFRHYYNLRALLRRVDPELARLAPSHDYPILGPDGESQSFADLPRRTPWNLAALTRRSPLSLRDLTRVNGRAALAMLGFDGDRTYARFDQTSAADYLDSLRFPAHARRMLFDVFAHSFFNPEREMSAAELLMMFHTYFLANREGLLFDVADRPLGRAFWRPLGDRLRGLGAEVRLATPVRAVQRHGAGFALALADGAIACDAVILALAVPGLKTVLAASPAIAAGPLGAEVASLDVTHPFAVWRLWLDRPTAAGRAPFAGTTGIGRLDNISLFHELEDESRAWARAHGGAVVELHAYAIEPDADDEELRAELLAGLHALYPETQAAAIVEQRYLVRRDCPAFRPGSFARRPTVTTAVPGLCLAGDFVRLPLPSALMERAATSGMMAANHLLAASDAQPEPIASPPRRGLLARLRV